MMQALVGPYVVHIVEWADLSEHTGSSVVQAVANASRPIIAPLDQRAWLQRVAAHLVNVTVRARFRQSPECE